MNLDTNVEVSGELYIPATLLVCTHLIGVSQEPKLGLPFLRLTSTLSNLLLLLFSLPPSTIFLICSTTVRHDVSGTRTPFSLKSFQSQADS